MRIQARGAGNTLRDGLAGKWVIAYLTKVLPETGKICVPAAPKICPNYGSDIFPQGIKYFTRSPLSKAILPVLSEAVLDKTDRRIVMELETLFLHPEALPAAPKIVQELIN